MSVKTVVVYLLLIFFSSLSMFYPIWLLLMFALSLYSLNWDLMEIGAVLLINLKEYWSSIPFLSLVVPIN